MGSSHARIREIAERQHGVVTRRQALAAGISDRVIAARIAEGSWRRLGSGVYSLFGHTSVRARLAAATAALPAVVSHEAAARLHGISGLDDIPVVTIPHRFSNRFPGVRIHESTDLRDDHIIEVAGLPATSVARTLFDLCRGRNLRTMRRLTERAIIDRLVTWAELDQVLMEIGRRGRPGTALFRELVDALGDGRRPAESELERRTIELIVRAGLPHPSVQAPLPWRTSISGRVDLLYPEAQLIIECDGRRWHSTSDSFQRDRRRDNLAQLGGWMVLRFTWNDITTRGPKVVAQVRQALMMRSVA